MKILGAQGEAHLGRLEKSTRLEKGCERGKDQEIHPIRRGIKACKQ